MSRIAAAVLFSLTTMALPVYADDSASPSAAAMPVSGSTRTTVPVVRPAVIPALYASYAALQVFDIYSTRQALARGATESNPLMKDVAGHTLHFAAVKAISVVGTVVAVERLWKKNKAAAIAAMVASNGVAAFVATRNSRTLRQLR